MFFFRSSAFLPHCSKTTGETFSFLALWFWPHFELHTAAFLFSYYPVECFFVFSIWLNGNIHLPPLLSGLAWPGIVGTPFFLFFSSLLDVIRILSWLSGFAPWTALACFLIWFWIVPTTPCDCKCRVMGGSLWFFSGVFWEKVFYVLFFFQCFVLWKHWPAWTAERKKTKKIMVQSKAPELKR